MESDFDLEQTGLEVDAVPLLALWRTWLPWKAGRATAERLEGALIARCLVGYLKVIDEHGRRHLIRHGAI